MSTDSDEPVRTFVLVPERDLGHEIAQRLREEESVEVIGVSTDPDSDAFRIFEADPDVVLADLDAGGMEFVSKLRLPPGKHRVVFFAPRSAAGCDACYQALVHGAEGVMCRPGTEDHSHWGELLTSIREGTPMRPHDCPAVKRLRDEDEGSSEA